MIVYNIRIATTTDRIPIMVMAHNFFVNTPLSTQKVSTDKIAKMVDTFLEGRKEEYIIFLLTYNEVPVGMLAGRVIESLITEGYTAYEQMWYVEPEHRGKHSLKLLNLFEQWSRQVGATMCVMANFDNTSVDKIYRKRGYNPVEHSYFKLLKEH